MIEKSKKLSKIYQKISNEFNCLFVNLNDFVTTSKIDGIHYDVENHKKIANYLSMILD